MELFSAVFYAFWQDRPRSFIWLALIFIFLFSCTSQSARSRKKKPEKKTYKSELTKRSAFPLPNLPVQDPVVWEEFQASIGFFADNFGFVIYREQLFDCFYLSDLTGSFGDQLFTEGADWLTKHYLDNRLSCFHVDKFMVVCDNPFFALSLVNLFRDRGYNIPFCKWEYDRFNYQQVLEARKVSEVRRQAIQRKSVVQNQRPQSYDLYIRFANDPFGFEEFCTSLFEQHGYQATRTKATGDGGYDISVVDFRVGGITLVECKCYAHHNKISRPMLQKLVGAGIGENAAQLLFITTSGYTKQALDYGRSVGMLMWTGEDLVEFMNEHSVVTKSDASLKSDYQAVSFDVVERRSRLEMESLKGYLKYPESDLLRLIDLSYSQFDKLGLRV